MTVSRKIGIGIDTGGTYTDAAAYDFSEGKVLACTKALTTRQDLTVGILNALDGLPPELLREAEVVSLSTTLATNACVEDKGGRAKLIFFGGDPRVIDELGGKYGLPPSSEIYLQECFTSFDGTIHKELDWEEFERRIQPELENVDGVGVIEMNALKNGAVIEKKAKALLEKECPIPVVCGHELFSQLNCLQRGSSTLLNAKLFPVIAEFLSAIREALARRSMKASLVIVRSDGSLMSEAFTRVHPVETLICGPAASVLGAAGLVREENMLVVDMGGTTTDLALIRRGEPVRTTDGVCIGRWKTFVDGLYIKTFGLGGDTAVHYQGELLRLEDYRIVPLCVAAQEYPSVIDSLRRLVEETPAHTRFLYEHYLLSRDISDNPRYTPEEKAFCAALSQGPLICREAAAAVGKDIYNLNVSRLLQEGVVQICGFTPTDAMHLRGDFRRYNGEASRLAGQFIAASLGCPVEELCERIYDEVKHRLYVNAVHMLLENQFPALRGGIGEETDRFIDYSYSLAKSGTGGDLISLGFSTDYLLCGIGAPIRVFLEDVAKMLGTRAVFPEHYEAANAIGAVVGNVCASKEIEVLPNSGAEGISGYTVYGLRENRVFQEQEDAERFALEEAERGAQEEARSRGAQGRLTVSSSLSSNVASLRNSTVYLGTKARASAIGSLGM